MSRKVIAAVDDDRISLFVIQRMFESTESTANIMCFASGSAFLQYMINHASLQDELPDVVTMDINMPVSTGWEILEELELLMPSLCKKPTIFMLSSSTDPKDAERALCSSIVERYVVKPVTRESCSSMLQAHE